MSKAITIWVDESTEIKINNNYWNLVGYLITDSDKNEDLFRKKLRELRKKHSSWKKLHGNDLDPSSRRIDLLDDWLKAFQEMYVRFHVFLYKRDGRYIKKEKTYEDYFARQSVFSLACKMKSSGSSLNTMFKNISTLRVLFDRRREHVADIVTKDQKTTIERLHELENVYKKAIGEQIENISSKNYKTNNFTIRFSFLASECFDLMQFSDSLLYLVRNKIEQDISGKSNIYTDLFDKHFINHLPKRTQNLGYRKIYNSDKKFNFFEQKKC